MWKCFSPLLFAVVLFFCGWSAVRPSCCLRHEGLKCLYHPDLGPEHRSLTVTEKTRGSKIVVVHSLCGKWVLCTVGGWAAPYQSANKDYFNSPLAILWMTRISLVQIGYSASAARPHCLDAKHWFWHCSSDFCPWLVSYTSVFFSLALLLSWQQLWLYAKGPLALFLVNF